MSSALNPCRRCWLGRGLRGAAGVAAWALAAAALAGSFDDFFAAIARDDVSTIQALAARGFELNTTDPKGQPGLILAVREGSLRVAEYLARHPKVRVDARNLHDETALMMAMLKGHLRIAEALRQRDADINKTGWTPLHYAAASTSERAPEAVQWLLEHHAYIDAESPNGTTPLMMAAQYGSEAVARLLLEEGADASLRNQLGLTAADFARRVGRNALAELLAASAGRPAAAPTEPPRPPAASLGPASAPSAPPSTAPPVAPPPPAAQPRPVHTPEPGEPRPLPPASPIPLTRPPNRW